FFSFSRNVGSGSFLPNREIIRLRAIRSTQAPIVTDTLSSTPRAGVFEQQEQDRWLLHVDFDGAEAEFAVLNGKFEGGKANWIELGAGQRPDAFHGKVQIHSRLIRAVGGHGVERIRHAN